MVYYKSAVVYNGTRKTDYCILSPSAALEEIPVGYKEKKKK
jgi:hypothetical protein